MCSCACARLPHPLFRPASSPKPRPASPYGPFPAPVAFVARASAGPGARDDAPAPPSSFDFLALKRELEEDEEAVVAVETDGGGDGSVSVDDGEREAERSAGGTGRRQRRRRRRRRQMARRSALLAKQVVSVRSARSLGFVSQLWVDAASWVVALVEVRPSLLSGEAEKFLLEDIYQVGDVVLVEDESVIENDYKLFGLHSLVAYNVVTSRWRNVGKVSTYCLFVEDVLDIVSDTIVVHEDAAPRVQRLTQGIWGTKNISGPGGEIDEYGRLGRRRVNREGKSGGRKLRRKTRDPEDEWELPMDY